MADHQIYTGDVFDLADQATRFVMTHISRSIGRHDGETGSAPTTYELPYDAVFELIVNAICHRDYTSHESVQVMLFKDRLEIWNAGSLPRGWTVKDLYKPHTSLPPNELVAGPMYLKGYIEKTGTGTDDVIRNCKAASLPPPVFTEGPDFRAVIYRSGVNDATEETRTEIPQKATQKTAAGSYEGSYERSYEILELIKSNPRILAKEIAAKKSISWRAVMKHIAHLKKDGRLRRIGPRKGGHWEVVVEAAK